MGRDSQAILGSHTLPRQEHLTAFATQECRMRVSWTATTIGPACQGHLSLCQLLGQTQIEVILARSQRRNQYSSTILSNRAGLKYWKYVRCSPNGKRRQSSTFIKAKCPLDALFNICLRREMVNRLLCANFTSSPSTIRARVERARRLCPQPTPVIVTIQATRTIQPFPTAQYRQSPEPTISLYLHSVNISKQ